MEQNKSPLLFYLDTEYAGTYVFEIGIINAQGEEIINSLVTHDKPWSQIYEEASESTRFWLNKNRIKYSMDEKWNYPLRTATMSARQVACTLEQAGSQHTDARFIEYLRGNADMSIVRRYLCEHDGLDYVLGDHYGFGLMPIWQEKLPGFWWASQDNIFALTRPEHPLASQAHRAMVDAKKLRILFQDTIKDSAQ